MMNYYGLDIPQRALLMTLLFVASNLALVALIRIINRKRVLYVKILLLVISAANAIPCVLFATEARVVKFSRELPEIVKAVCEMPLVICILLLALSIGYEMFVFLSDIKFRKNNLSRASVKESLDKLPMGLCFFRERGRVILVNDVMHELCYKIVGRDLQNASLFWEILSAGEVLADVERLSSGEYPSFRLKDGRVWSFSRTELEDIVQLTAADTTDLSNINAELKVRISELSAVNARLREYGEKVDELARTKERIDLKAGIHRELGQALLVTRRYILNTAESADIPIRIWKKNVAMLTREAVLPEKDIILSEFLSSAKNAGVDVEISGELPVDKKQNTLCVIAAVECLVNGVRHANASALYIAVGETENEIMITYENNGDLPKGDIVEGEGISSLRHSAKRLGGRVEVSATPRFSLTIILPKEGGGL